MNLSNYRLLDSLIDRQRDVVQEVQEDLFPLRRSLISKGFDDSLSIIEKKMLHYPLQCDLFPSGTSLGTWKVPNKWDLIDFFIKDENDNVLFDLKKTNLRVVIGSKSFKGWVNLEEIEANIFTHPEIPEAVPYVTNYYGKKGWGICLSQLELAKLKKNYKKIFINIDINETKGNLKVAKKIFTGYNKKKILFWTYLCHPQMAQNELSGPIVWGILGKIIKQYIHKNKKNRYCYELALSAETIGAIGYIKTNKKSLEDYVSAHVLTCLGASSRSYVIQESINSNSYPERVIRKALTDMKQKFIMNSYQLRGSDERQFSFPTVAIETSYFCTKKYHQFREYHTNLDNLDFISTSQLLRSAKIYLYCILIYENNYIFLPTSLGEPRLGPLGLWHEINVGGKIPPSFKITDLLVLFDGKRDLLEITEILDIKFTEVLSIINLLLKNKLIKKINDD